MTHARLEAFFVFLLFFWCAPLIVFVVCPLIALIVVLIIDVIQSSGLSWMFDEYSLPRAVSYYQRFFSNTENGRLSGVGQWFHVNC